jgi:hypothetical protein
VGQIGDRVLLPGRPLPDGSEGTLRCSLVVLYLPLCHRRYSAIRHLLPLSRVTYFYRLVLDDQHVPHCDVQSLLHPSLDHSVRVIIKTSVHSIDTRSIYSFNHERAIDPIAFSAGVVQAFAFWMFFVLCFTKVNNNFAEGLDEEAQWDEFDSRWGTVETFAGEWDGLLLHAEGQPLWKEEKSIETRIIPVIRVEDVDSNRPPVPLPPY